MKNFLKSLMVLTIPLLVFSCTSSSTTNYKPTDFSGKTFVLKGDQTPAQLGGQQTIKFIDDKNLEYKTGDIMNTATFTIKGKEIKYSNQIMNTNHMLEIIDAKTLKGDHNSIWILQ